MTTPTLPPISWIRIVVILALVVMVVVAGFVSIVLSFALLLRYLRLHTVWDDIFPWLTNRLDMIATYVAGGTVMTGLLLKRVARRRA